MAVPETRGRTLGDCSTCSDGRILYERNSVGGLYVGVTVLSSETIGKFSIDVGYREILFGYSIIRVKGMEM